MQDPTVQSGAPRGFNRPDGVALKEHLETRICALQENVESKLHAMDRATALALTTMDKRLEGMNEFRDALRDTTARLATREELAMQAARTAECVERVTGDINELNRYRAMMEGKASQSSVNLATLLSVVGLILALVSLALKLL